MLRVIQLTVQDIFNSIDFEADCTVNMVDASFTRVRELVNPMDRVTRVAGRSILDRSELKSVLLGLQPRALIDVELMSVRTQSQVDFGGDVGEGDSAHAMSVSCDPPPPDEDEEDLDKLNVATSFSEFGPAPAQQAPESLNQPRPNGPTPNNGGMLTFDAIDTTHHLSPESGADSAPASSISVLQTSLERALRRIELGRCVILLVDPEVNPLGEIEGLANQHQMVPTVVDFGVKLKNRISDTKLGDLFRDSMKNGKWFVVVRATKCLTLLANFAALLQECWANQLRDVHANSRIIIATEPHPHFPASLVEGSKTMNVRNTMTQSAILFESIAGSVRKLAVLRDHMEDQMDRGATAVQPVKKARGVRFASQVDVVDIESRQVFQVEALSAASVSSGNNKAANTVGSVRLRHTSSALPNDKFFAVARAGEQRRYAVASSLGNLYVVDHRGAALLSAHVHDASIWDCDFHGKDLFVTGAEDSSAVCWRNAGDGNVERLFTMKCPNDVYSVRFCGDGSCIAAGGLMSSMMLRSTSPNGQAHNLELQTSVQVLAAYGPKHLVAGGGDGSAFIVDPTTLKVVQQWRGIHSKKVPAVAINGDTLITGSFDSSIRLWDIRSGSTQPLNTMKFKQYITGLDCDGNYLAGCVGDSMYLWDVRKLDTILGGCAKAWAGLSRAIRVDGLDQSLITASPDGIIRYWAF